jgi:hypothetical protein
LAHHAFVETRDAVPRLKNSLDHLPIAMIISIITWTIGNKKFGTIRKGIAMYIMNKQIKQRIIMIPITKNQGEFSCPGYKKPLNIVRKRFYIDLK